MSVCLSVCHGLSGHVLFSLNMWRFEYSRIAIGISGTLFFGRPKQWENPLPRSSWSQSTREAKWDIHTQVKPVSAASRKKKTTNWYKLVSSCFQSQFHEHVISSGNASLLYQSSAVLIDEETGNLQVNKAPHWSPFMAGWWLWKCGLTMVYGRYNELVDGDCNGL